VRLNHVTLVSADPERALPFYEGLGLTVIVLERDTDGRLRYARLTFPEGDSTLSLERGAHSPPSPPSPPSTPVDDDVSTASAASAVLFFECDDLDARVAALTAAGYRFEAGAETKPWLWREARLRDPDGQTICLFRAGFYRLDPPWRIASAVSVPLPQVAADLVAVPEAFLAENNRGYVDVPIPSGRDGHIGAFLEEIERGGRATAEEAARRLGPPYTATLVAYAERMASLGVRTATGRPAQLGILAITLVWSGAADVRTAIPVLGVLFDGIRRAGGDPRQAFREIAELGPPDVAPVLRDFLSRPDLDEIAEEMGFSAGRDRDGFRYRRTWGSGRVDLEDVT
jgi:catechol 2,3-dioxygenase-like lactoylglutathione lyase family enzyme